jgi:hypothetical protein
LKSKISMLEEQLKTENTEEINNLNKKYDEEQQY